MNTIEDLLKNHKENPSEGVWDKLNAQLDAEMPVVEKVVSRGVSKTWKLAAAVIGSVVVVGSIALITLMYLLGDRSHQKVGNDVPPVTHPTEVVATESANTAETVEEPMLADNVATVESPAIEEKNSKEVVTPTVSEEPVAPSAKKQNVRQEVLPANSTLAKQLAADPVLKNLSDDSVDWSAPTHLTIPNLFTPNGDHVNDLFVIDGIEQYASPKLVVRDKNNRVVYQSADYHNNWGGENCQDGVYNYEFTFYYNGIENQATGKVRIIRS